MKDFLKRRKGLAFLIVILAVAFSFFGGSEEEVPVEETTPVIESTEVANTEEAGISIIGGEIGEYGSTIDLNEETRVVYHVPAGKYKVINNGMYTNQFNVYSDEMVTTDEGWQEPAETLYVKLIDSGASEIVTIEDGQYVYVVDGEWQLIKQ